MKLIAKFRVLNLGLLHTIHDVWSRMVSFGFGIRYACVRLHMFCGILFSSLLDVKVDQFSCESSTNCLQVEFYIRDFDIQFMMCGLGRVQHSVCLCEATNVLPDPVFFVARCSNGSV